MPPTAKTASFATALAELRATLRRLEHESPSPELAEAVTTLLDLQGEAERMDVIRIRMKGELDQGKIPDRFPRLLRETIRDLQVLLDSYQDDCYPV